MTDDREQLVSAVNEAAGKLIEHCDSVQIFVTLHKGDEQNTISYETGRGSFYCRYGQVVEWISIQEQYQRNEAIRRDKG